jgi:hypothetical protein
MRAVLLILAFLGAVHATSGILEVDLIFPRNETYAPTSDFPFIIGFKNSELAPLLNPRVSLNIYNMNALNESGVLSYYDLKSANWSSNDPYYEIKAFHQFKFNEEGSWLVKWGMECSSCTENTTIMPAGNHLFNYDISRYVMFTTKNSAQEVDLLAATTDRNCSENEGIAISVATTVPIPEGVSWDQGSICASVASTTPAPTPCRVKFDSDAASSMSSVLSSMVCRKTSYIGDPCSPEHDTKNAAQGLAVGAAVGFAAAFGALSYMVG